MSTRISASPDKRADQRVALPLREQVAGVDQQRARADRRVPPHLGLLEAVAGL